jgi:hypothetical protein
MASRRLKVELEIPGSELQTLDWELEGSGPWAVGRFGCDFEIRHSSVSRRHFSFAVHSKTLTVKNLSQTNGIFFGSEPVVESKWASQEWVQFGECKLRWVSLSGEAPLAMVIEPSAPKSSAPGLSHQPRARSSSSESNVEQKVQRFKNVSISIGLVLLVAAGVWFVESTKKTRLAEDLKSLQSTAPQEWLAAVNCPELEAQWRQVAEPTERKAILQSELSFYEKTLLEQKSLMEKATLMDARPPILQRKQEILQGLNNIQLRVDCARTFLSRLN